MIISRVRMILIYCEQFTLPRSVQQPLNSLHVSCANDVLGTCTETTCSQHGHDYPIAANKVKDDMLICIGLVGAI